MGSVRRVYADRDCVPEKMAWALIDPASGKLLAGAFRTEAEAKGAQWRLGMGRVELVEVAR